MNNSILLTIKKLLGIDESDTSFDTDLIIHINSIFSNLHQMGVGPESPLVIGDETAVWEDFTQNNNRIEQVKTYIYAKVKLIFDPPTSSIQKESFDRMATELEYRLYVDAGNY